MNSFTAHESRWVMEIRYSEIPGIESGKTIKERALMLPKEKKNFYHICHKLHHHVFLSDHYFRTSFLFIERNVQRFMNTRQMT